MDPAGRRDIDEPARLLGGSPVLVDARGRAVLGFGNPTAKQDSRQAKCSEPRQNPLPHPHLILLFEAASPHPWPSSLEAVFTSLSRSWRQFAGKPSLKPSEPHRRLLPAGAALRSE